MPTRRTSIFAAKKSNVDPFEAYGAIVSVYWLTPDTEPAVIAATQRKDVVAAWRIFGELAAVSEATMLPVCLCRRRLIEAGILAADTRNPYYRPQEATCRPNR